MNYSANEVFAGSAINFRDPLMVADMLQKLSILKTTSKHLTVVNTLTKFAWGYLCLYLTLSQNYFHDIRKEN